MAAILKKLYKENGVLTAVFNISHNNEKTSLDQDLILRRTDYGWVASMALENLPEQETATEAAMKLAEWFVRLGGEMKDHEYNLINLNTVDMK